MNTRPLKNYYWKALNRQGEITVGLMRAKSRRDIRHQLKQTGQLVQNITCQTSWFKHKKLNAMNLMMFCQQASALIGSGIPVMNALKIMRPQTKGLKTVLALIHNDVMTGSTLALAFTNYPDFFNASLCRLIDIGERTGTLDRVFQNLTVHYERIGTFQQKIKKALTYPLMVVCVGAVVSYVFIAHVIPQFASLYEQMNVQLPLITQWFIQLSLLFKHGSLIIAIILSLLTLTWTAYRQWFNVALLIERCFAKLPLVGILLQTNVEARFTRTLGLMCATGLPVLESLKLLRHFSTLRRYRQTLDQSIINLSQGNLLTSALSSHAYFSSELIQMLMIGEESGRIDEMLFKASEYAEQRLDHTLDMMARLIEPCMMVLIGLFVGGLILAMYLPLLNLGAIL